MAVETPPVWIQTGGETAERARRALSATFGGRGGIVADVDLAVTQNGTPNMSVNVASGQVVIPGTQATFQGHYVVENRGALNVPIAAANATNPRKDLIICKVEDAAYSGSNNAASIVAVTGTPAASPAEPSVPSNAWVLAVITVPANASSITNSNIADQRTSRTTQKGRAAALGGVIVTNSANRPLPSSSEGQVLYETDTDLLRVSDASIWASILLAPQKSTAGAARIHWGPYSGTTDGSANLNVSHGAPFTPTAGFAQHASPAGGANFGVPVVTALASSTITIRYIGITGSTSGLAVSGFYIVVA